MSGQNRSEAIVVFNDLVNSPIVSLKYEIKRNSTSLAKGVTNTNGETSSIQARLGDNIDIYVKKLTNDEMKRVKTVTLTEADAIITLTSPKVLLEMGTVVHEEEKGNYKRKTYVVKSGDTLAKIAHVKGTTVAALAHLNRIEHINSISVGQIIKLPPAPIPPGAPQPPSNAPNDPTLAEKIKAEAQKLLARLKDITPDRGDSGSPKEVVKGLCKDQSGCIKKGDAKSEFIREINIRLAGFGGALPTDEFTDLTEACVKQFQRDYMGALETGRVCGGTLVALDDFMNKYSLDTYFNQMKCPCSQYGGGKQCTGWGAQRSQNEYPGIHRSVIWALRAMKFYISQKDGELGYSENI